LLVKTSDANKIPKGTTRVKLGRGFNGSVMGVRTTADKLLLDTFEVAVLDASITYSGWQTHASIGMEIIRNYAIVLNYCQGYAGLRKLL
jgi:hypothetical protein